MSRELMTPEAAQRMVDLRDDKFREQLSTYLSFRMAEASLRKLDWYSFNELCTPNTSNRGFIVQTSFLHAKSVYPNQKGRSCRASKGGSLNE